MPFTFKLARRLAQAWPAHLSAVLAGLMACDVRTASITDVGAVDGAITQLVVLPKTVSLHPSDSAHFQAFGRTAAGDSLPVDVSWSAEGGEIDSAGWFQAGQAAGAYRVVTRLAKGEVADTAQVQIEERPAPPPPPPPSPVPVASVAVSPSLDTVPAGQTRQLSATLKDAVGNVLDGRTIEWASSEPTVATVSSTGVVAAVAAGSTVITSTSEGKSGSATIIVSAALPPPPPGPPPAPVATVTVGPATATVELGGTEQFTATLKDVGGAVLIDRSVVWTSSDTTVARVSSSGLATGILAGTATLTATSERQSGTATLTVTAPPPPPPPPPAPVATVTVSPATATVDQGGTQQFTVTLKDASGAVLTGRSISWMSSNPAVATISSTGLATGAAPGTATLTATSEGQSGTVTLTVTAPPPPPPPPVATVTVSPATATVALTGTQQFTATLKDASGAVLTGRSISWTSSNPAVATVSSTGLATGLLAGTASLTATSEGHGGTADLTVTAPPLPPPPPPPGNPYPNEPAGFAPIAENAFTALPTRPASANGILGKWFLDAGLEYTTVQVDVSSPRSPGSVLQTRYPTGLTSGVGPSRWGGWDQGWGGTDYSKIYFSAWLKLDRPDWENQQVGTKLGYIGYGNDKLTDSYLFLVGTGQQVVQSAFWLQFRQQNLFHRNISQNVNTSKLMTAGEWHHFEIVMELNTLGQANGTLKWWVDGQLIMDYADLVYITPDNLKGFQGYHFGGIWGGAGGVKTRDDSISFDHLYISGAR